MPSSFYATVLREKPPDVPPDVLSALSPASVEPVSNHGASAIMWAIEKSSINKA
jgi:hypothetical protein